MPYLEKEILVLENAIKISDKKAEHVSASNVAWHIDHSLKVIIRVCEFLITSQPSDYKWKFNKWRFVVFLRGDFPRGKAKAPKQVLPPEIIKIEDLKAQLKKVKELMSTVKKLPPKSNFKHHIFGMLPLKKTVTFLKIHTKHHIKIINDIANSNAENI